MGWVNPRVGLGWVGLGWVGFRKSMLVIHVKYTVGILFSAIMLLLFRWVGLGWVNKREYFLGWVGKLVGWVGFGFRKPTHGQL